MRLDPVASQSTDLTGLLMKGGGQSASGSVPFGDMLQQASKEDSGRYIVAETDGTFRMIQEGEREDLEKDKHAEAQELPPVLQALVHMPGMASGWTPKLESMALPAVQSFVHALPGAVGQDRVPMLVRFEQGPKGLVVVVYLAKASMVDTAQQQRSGLQNKLSEILDRTVTVRFVYGNFEKTLEATPMPQMGQPGQQQRHKQTSPGLQETEDEEGHDEAAL